MRELRALPNQEGGMNSDGSKIIEIVVKYCGTTFGLYSRGAECSIPTIPINLNLDAQQQGFFKNLIASSNQNAQSAIQKRLICVETQRAKYRTFMSQKLEEIRESSEYEDYRALLLKQIPNLAIEEMSSGEVQRVNNLRSSKLHFDQITNSWEYISASGAVLKFPPVFVQLSRTPDEIIEKIIEKPCRPTFSDPFYAIQAKRAEEKLRQDDDNNRLLIKKRTPPPLTVFEQQEDHHVDMDVDVDHPAFKKYKHQDIIERSKLRNKKRLAEMEERRRARLNHLDFDKSESSTSTPTSSVVMPRGRGRPRKDNKRKAESPLERPPLSNYQLPTPTQKTNNHNHLPAESSNEENAQPKIQHPVNVINIIPQKDTFKRTVISRGKNMENLQSVFQIQNKI